MLRYKSQCIHHRHVESSLSDHFSLFPALTLFLFRFCLVLFKIFSLLLYHLTLLLYTSPTVFCPLLLHVVAAFYSAAPLTSAGIIPIMQSLCPDGQRDEFGFLQYKNSTFLLFFKIPYKHLVRSLWTGVGALLTDSEKTASGHSCRGKAYK